MELAPHFYQLKMGSPQLELGEATNHFKYLQIHWVTSRGCELTRQQPARQAPVIITLLGNKLL